MTNTKHPKINKGLCLHRYMTGATIKMQRIWSPESIIYSMMLEYFFFCQWVFSKALQDSRQIVFHVFLDCFITLREALGLFSGSMHRYFPTMECKDYHLATICHVSTFLNKFLPDKTISKGVIYMANFIPGWNFSSVDRADISAWVLQEILLKWKPQFQLRLKT